MVPRAGGRSVSPPAGMFRFAHVFQTVSDLTAIQYFKAKNMTDEQVAVFVEERKWDYRGSFSSCRPLLLQANDVFTSIWVHGGPA